MNRFFKFGAAAVLIAALSSFSLAISRHCFGSLSDGGAFSGLEA